MKGIARWMVVFHREGDTEVSTFEWETDARDLYERLAAGWTEVYLTKIIHSVDLSR